tara:strand:+ start:28968 stop:30074 length:1107 start_codon:yes stop_codon:yes gene_type:complete
VKLITIIIGTRPEAIKLAPVAKIFLNSELIKVRVVLTGQHENMIEKILELFEVPIQANLKLMKKGQSLSELTSRIVMGLENEFITNKPNLVILQGDTTTALGAALAAFYQKIKVAHVEAGLRTRNILNPFPEEANRRIISQIADLHFAPTEQSKQNLISSNVYGNIVQTGNTVIDALLEVKDKVPNYELKNFNKDKDDLILLTVHRRENWGRNLQNICFAIKEIIQKIPNVIFLIPMHPNQIVRDEFLKILGKSKKVMLVDPLDYGDLIGAMKMCKIVLTDSGGIQEEAPSLGKPILVLRESTERQEGVEAGTAKIIGSNPKAIVEETINLLQNENEYKKMINYINPYGDGKASKRIYKAVINFFKVI